MSRIFTLPILFAGLLLVSNFGMIDLGQTAEETAELKQETQLERQVRHIASKLRCPVCQGETIYDSHSEVAMQMKALIAEKIQKGESEAQIVRYFVDRYGNFMLMKPPAKGIHWVIWLLPLFLGLLGAFVLFCTIQASKTNKSDDDDNQDKSQDIEGLHL